MKSMQAMQSMKALKSVNAKSAMKASAASSPSMKIMKVMKKPSKQDVKQQECGSTGLTEEALASLEGANDSKVDKFLTGLAGNDQNYFGESSSATESWKEPRMSTKSIHQVWAPVRSGTAS